MGESLPLTDLPDSNKSGLKHNQIRNYCGLRTGLKDDAPHVCKSLSFGITSDEGSKVTTDTAETDL